MSNKQKWAAQKKIKNHQPEKCVKPNRVGLNRPIRKKKENQSTQINTKRAHIWPRKKKWYAQKFWPKKKKKKVKERRRKKNNKFSP